MPREWTTKEQKAELESHTDAFLDARRNGGLCLEKFMDARFTWLISKYPIDTFGFNDPGVNQGTSEEVHLKKTAALKLVN